MNGKTLRMLGAAVLVLVAALMLIEMRGPGHQAESGALLLPGLKERANDITTVTITRSDAADPLVLRTAEGQWLLASHDDYGADVAEIRALLNAMMNATAIETKTSNPALHSQLGLRSPDIEGSKGVLVDAAGDDIDFRIIFGNVARTKFRYARLPDQDQTWLIDQNPDIPRSPGDWLQSDLLDIDSSRIKRMAITHVSGDIIRMHKESAEDGNFIVADIPEGRELSYATVANGVAGALNDLQLEDVQRDPGAPFTVTSEFSTFDGLSVTVNTVKTEEAMWISVHAVSDNADDPEAAAINDRTDGWQFRIADYKANLITREWDDILKTIDD